MKIKIYGSSNCSRCMVAKNLASENGIDFEYFDDYDETLALVRKHKTKKIPVIMKEDGTVISFEDFITEVKSK